MHQTSMHLGVGSLETCLALALRQHCQNHRGSLQSHLYKACPKTQKIPLTVTNTPAYQLYALVKPKKTLTTNH